MSCFLPRVLGLLRTQQASCILTNIRTLKRPPVNTSQLKEGRRTGVIGMKVGMLAIWDSWGVRHPVTVIHLDDVRVLQVKREETDGYTALQLGAGERKMKRAKKALMIHCAKVNSPPKRKLMEFRITADCVIEPGTKISSKHFVPGQLVDVCGISKGKGFQGGIKRWNMSGGNASHGASKSHRIVGSTGHRQNPGRVFKNKKMAGRLGGDRVTTQNLKVMKVDPARDLIYVRGAVPGNAGGFLRVVDAVKGPFYPEDPSYPTDLEQREWSVKDEVFAPVPEHDILNLPLNDAPI